MNNLTPLMPHNITCQMLMGLETSVNPMTDLTRLGLTADSRTIDPG